MGLLIRAIIIWGIIALLPLLSISQKNTIDSLKQIYESPVEDSVKVKSLLKLCQAYIPSNFDSVKYYLDSAYCMAKRNKLYQEVASSLNLYGIVAWYKGDLPNAKKYFEHSHEFSKKNGFVRGQAKAAGNLGLVCSKFGDYTTGQPYFEEAIALYRKLKDTSTVSKNQVDLSNNLAERGLYKEAVEQLLEATHYFEKQNDSLNLIYAYFGLGDLHYKMKSFDPALHYFEESIRMEDKENPANHISSSLMGIGLIYEKLKKDFTKAEEYYLQSLDAANEYNYKSALVGVTNNLASIYFQQKDYPKALQQFKLAYKLLKEGNLYNAEIPLIINLGNNYLHLEKYDSARIYLNEGLLKAEEAHSPEHVEIVHLHLFQLDSALGNYLPAIEHLKKAQNMHDSLWKQENLDRINELEVQYETEKKEQENSQLKKENELKANIIQNHRTIGVIITLALLLMIVLGFWLFISKKRLKHLNDKLESQKIDLQKLNITKDKFFSIIAHDLKSPFSSLLGLLDMLEEDFDTLSDNEKMEIIVSLQKSSHNTYNLLMNLLDWSRSQRGQIKFEAEEFRLSDSIHNVTKVLISRSKLKNHTLELDIPEELTVNTDKMMLESIVLNLVTNSIKFTNNEGRIWVSAKQIDTSLLISIKDNGIGIPSEKIAQLFELDNDFKRLGTNSELGTGLGLILCHDFVSMMGGKISVESAEGKGSTFTIAIPL
ncbi:MAG: tetratricopeptide repeat protein [Bacteroidales bacterium]|nr:tetratricopeptide repeat protein [Bacteroidales bacterium]MCF8457386.1 tetratricopeptide repeat protein [Bacteroidales bacterium]